MSGNYIKNIEHHKHAPVFLGCLGRMSISTITQKLPRSINIQNRTKAHRKGLRNFIRKGRPRDSCTSSSGLLELRVQKGKVVQNNQDQDQCSSPKMSRLERQKLIKIINHQRSLKHRNKISITPKTHPDIKISRTNKMPFLLLPRKPFPGHARYSIQQCHPV
jgi:hypothetical protein